MIIVLQIKSVYAQQGSGYQVLETLDHNPSYFTQGLEVHDGLMFESSGLYEKSKIRKYKPDTDEALLEVPLADKYFAEGLTLFENELFVLTWKENTLLVIDPDNLKVKRELTYVGQGWGLASNGNQLIMSNGSDKIYFRNPDSFKIENELKVRYKQRAVQRLNELEFAQGYIWANIWLTPAIVKINPTSGAVVAVYDLENLVKKHSSGSDERVLNGIAYDHKRGAYWITGKLWPKRYLVKFD